MKRVLRNIYASLIILFASSPAWAGQYMSSHFCQPYQHGAVNGVTLYYQNQGSILAAADNMVTCPILTSNQNAQQHVKVYYQSFGVQATPAVSCRFWKITANNLSQVSPVVSSQPSLNAGAFDIYSPNGSQDAIGYNLECTLKRGAKILSYYVY